MVKIRFNLPPNDGSGGEAEWLWGEPAENGGFLVQNVPIFFKGVSFQDVVSVKSQEGYFVFDGIVSRGGHSTYRIYAKSERTRPEIVAILESLKTLRCEFEVATKSIVGVDVLPEADIYAVYRALEAAEESGVLEFDDGHCGRLLRAEMDTTDPQL